MTENTQELNHEESYLLVNCFIEFSLVAARHSSDGKTSDGVSIGDCMQDTETIS